MAQITIVRVKKKKKNDSVGKAVFRTKDTELYP